MVNRPWALALVAVWVGLGSGCAYTLHMTSSVPAVVELPDGETVVTPADVTLKLKPFASQRVVVRADGYRDLVTDLRRTEATAPRWFGDLLFHPSAVLGLEPRGEIIWVLVEDHDHVE